MVGDLVSWEKVKTILTLDDEQKETVEFLISDASTQAEKIADRILAAQDIAITIDGTGGREYLLPSFPVNSTEMVRVNDNELQPNEYSVKKEGILRFKNYRPDGWEAISYKGNIGYEEIPEDLQRAVIEIISANLRRFAQHGGNVGIKSFSADRIVTTQYEIDIPLTARQTILKYSREPNI
jgi:hypothetical protein